MTIRMPTVWAMMLGLGAVFLWKIFGKKRTVPCIRCGTAEYRQSREEIFRMFKTDLQIAQECNMEHILKVAEKAGIPEEYVDCYGKYKGKISSK